jgi:hypothetical protein
MTKRRKFTIKHYAHTTHSMSALTGSKNGHFSALYQEIFRLPTDTVYLVWSHAEVSRDSGHLLWPTAAL